MPKLSYLELKELINLAGNEIDGILEDLKTIPQKENAIMHNLLLNRINYVNLRSADNGWSEVQQAKLNRLRGNIVVPLHEYLLLTQVDVDVIGMVQEPTLSQIQILFKEVFKKFNVE
jgi:hypothetical protein